MEATVLMSETLRNGLVAFGMAATAVIAVSLVLLFATSSGDDGNGRVGDATSVTPAVLGESEAPTPTPTATLTQ
jgi:hypothetical protein